MIIELFVNDNHHFPKTGIKAYFHVSILSLQLLDPCKTAEGLGNRPSYWVPIKASVIKRRFFRGKQKSAGEIATFKQIQLNMICRYLHDLQISRKSKAGRNHASEAVVFKEPGTEEKKTNQKKI